MTRTIKFKKILSLVFAVVIVVCTFLVTTLNVSAAENTPQTTASGTMYETCNVYVRSDVYPVVVHYVTYTSNGNNSVFPENNIAAEEFDVTINSAEEYITLPVYKWLNAFFRGGVITSIKCKGFSPSTCSVSFDERFGSWEENLLTVNKFDVLSTYFNGYAVEDTSSKTIDISFLGGYDNGYADGYEKGVQDGYDTGYDYGYRIGQESVDNSNTGNGSTSGSTSGSTNGTTDNTTDTTDTQTTDSEAWKSMLGIGGVLILLAIIVLGVTKVSKEIK